MPWNKDRPYSPGEMEFHLTGLRQMRGEAPEQPLNMERVERRLAARHHPESNIRRNE